MPAYLAPIIPLTVRGKWSIGFRGRLNHLPPLYGWPLGPAVLRTGSSRAYPDFWLAAQHDRHPRKAESEPAGKTGREESNPKRVYRVMKVHGLLLQRDGERREERRHDGRVAVDLRNTRCYSDGLEITCDNGEKVRVAFALDCCDREAMGHVATTGGITVEDVQGLIVATAEHRYGQVKRVPEPVEWLTDNGSRYTARNTRAFARGVWLIPRTTPVSSPQSNGMAEAFVRTLKRDYVRVSPRPNAQRVIDQLPGWFAHYNEVHPHRALRYRSLREFMRKPARLC